jgi:hypothetical protein
MKSRLDDEGSKYLLNGGKLKPDYVVLQPIRQPSSIGIPFGHTMGTWLRADFFQNEWNISVFIFLLIVT